MYTYMIKITIL